MPATKSFLAQELSNFFEAAWLDLPAEAGKVLLGAGNQETLRTAGWKAYDAWVSLANELTNAVYSNPAIGEATGRVMETALRWRQLGGTLAAAVFGNFWPSIGLPTHSEVTALREEFLALRNELASYSGKAPVVEDSPEADPHDELRAMWKGIQFNGFRGKIGTGSTVRRPLNQVKRHAAA
jgi:hypothetical protein